MTQTSNRQVCIHVLLHSQSIAHTYSIAHALYIAHTLKLMKCNATLVHKTFGPYFTCIMLSHYIYFCIISVNKFIIANNFVQYKISWTLNFDSAFFYWSILFKYFLCISSNSYNLPYCYSFYFAFLLQNTNLLICFSST